MVVIAAAGSGKTSVLTYRILNMVKNYGVDPTTILAVTFSKKAKESIEQRLGKLGVANVNVETFHSLSLLKLLLLHMDMENTRYGLHLGKKKSTERNLL